MAPKKTTDQQTKEKKMAVTKAVKFDVDSDLIRRLADLMAETGLSEIELGDGDLRLRVVGGAGNVQAVSVAASPLTAEPSPNPQPATAADAAENGRAHA